MKMKFTATIIFLFGMIAFAQAQLTVGVKGGKNIAWEEYGDVGLPDDADITIEKFQVSAFAYQSLNSWLSIGIEPGFAQRGAACEPGFFSGQPGVFEGDSRLVYNYWELPVMARAEVGLFNGRCTAYTKLGYGASFASKMTRTIEIPISSTAPTTNEIPFEAEPNKKRFDTGGYGAVGFTVKAGPGSILLEGNYYHAVVNADRWFVSQNRSMSLQVGYQIGL